MTVSGRRPTTIAEAAVAIVTAHLGELGNDVVDTILADVDTAELASFLAAVMAHMVRETDGGPQWLQRYGLVVAEGMK